MIDLNSKINTTYLILTIKSIFFFKNIDLNIKKID